MPPGRAAGFTGHDMTEKELAAHQQFMEDVFRTIPADLAGLYRGFMAEECFSHADAMEFCMVFLHSWMAKMGFDG